MGIKRGVEIFPDDGELNTFLRDVEMDMDDPDGDMKPRFLGLLVLALLY
jgi:hypothetical protein